MVEKYAREAKIELEHSIQSRKLIFNILKSVSLSEAMSVSARPLYGELLEMPKKVCG